MNEEGNNLLSDARKLKRRRKKADALYTELEEVTHQKVVYKGHKIDIEINPSNIVIRCDEGYAFGYAKKVAEIEDAGKGKYLSRAKEPFVDDGHANPYQRLFSPYNLADALEYAYECVIPEPCTKRKLNFEKDCIPYAANHPEYETRIFIKDIRYRNVAYYIPAKGQQGYVLSIERETGYPAAQGPKILRAFLPFDKSDLLIECGLGRIQKHEGCCQNSLVLNFKTDYGNYLSSLHEVSSLDNLREELPFLFNKNSFGEFSTKIRNSLKNEKDSIELKGILYLPYSSDANHLPDFIPCRVWEISKGADREISLEPFEIIEIRAPIGNKFGSYIYPLGALQPVQPEIQSQIEGFFKLMKKQLLGGIYPKSVKDVLGGFDL
jgi:hypothetical protein